TDPRQASNPGNASSIGGSQDGAKVARYGKYVENAYKRANLLVDAVIKKVGKSHGVPRSNIIVVSDHGFAPFHTAVSANNLLAAALAKGGFPASYLNNNVRIVTSGPAAHIYVNLQGRESNGNTDATTYQNLVNSISAFLTNYEDTNSTFNGSLSDQTLFT